MPRCVFAWEPLAALLDDGLAEHVARHWEEVGVHKDTVPLAVDWERYHHLEEVGILKTMAARRDEKLVGYASYMVMPHLHYATTLHALNDGIYVDLAMRGVGIPLIRAAERALAEIARPAWVRIIYHVKMQVEKERGTLGPVFERLGYAPFETCYDKVVRA